MSEAVGQGQQKSGDWRISDGAKRCERCSTPFLPEHEFFSQLTIPAGTELAFVRADYCPSCWNTVRRAAETEGGGSTIFWKTRRAPADSKGQVVDLASLQALFVNLIDDERPEVEGLRYVVALLLTRKKLLKQVRKAGLARGDLLFRDPRDESGEKTLYLQTPDFSPEALERLKDQLGEILD